MAKKHVFNCVVVGDDSVTLECLRLLLDKGHKIEWVATHNSKVAQYAKTKGISNSANLDVLGSYLDSNKVDYLFSIVNSQILPEAIIKNIKILSINYHNSLLPTYAGIHAVPLAILNHESHHGITWHVMTTDVDAGHILKQESFAIDPDETAHSLYVKCSCAAIQTFQVLVDELSQNSYQSISQNITARTYYGRNYRLPHFGFIRWDNTADEIDTLCRALFFDNQENVLGHPKVIIGNECFIIKNIKKLKKKSDMLPGTIESIENMLLQVSTGSEDVEISSIFTCEGMQVEINQLINFFNLEKGKKLGVLKNDSEIYLENHYKALNKNGEYWLNEINNINKSFLPLTSDGLCYQFKTRISPKKIDISDIASTMERGNIALIVSAILVVLYRLSDYKNLSFKLSNDESISLSKKHMMLSQHFIISTKFNPGLSLLKVKKQIEGKLEKISEDNMFIKDIWLRKNKEVSYEDIKVVFIITDNINDSYFIENNQIYFLISKDGKNLSYFCKEKNNIQMITFNRKLGEYICNALHRFNSQENLLINEMPIDTNENINKITYLWNKTEKDISYPAKTIHELLQYWSSICPHKVAVSGENGYLTYLQLYEESKRFAQHLCMQNIKPGDLVAIYMDRSLELFITIFGILAVGAAYVPIDVDYPIDRIRYILNDSGSKCIVFKPIHDKENILKDLHINKINFTSVVNDNIRNDFDLPNAEEDSLCYVIYTSGTTGKPKGVMISHKNVLNYATWFSDIFHFKEKNIIEFSSSIAFDLSVSCTMFPIMNGCKVIICLEETKSDPEEYLNFIKTNNITHIECTPVYLSRMLDYPLLITRLTHLKWVMLGCDTLVKADVEKWISLNPFQKLANEYGPTESTVAMTQHTITSRNINQYGPCLPIGKPAHNVKTYILDAYNNICPPGFAGELYIAGASLSRGYLNKPEIQNSKFLISPFESIEPYKRLYATGDLAFYHQDGSIEFLGRKDNQIKIRGYRVELQEVEAVILSYPGVKQCIVVANKNHSNLRLDAYVVASDKSTSANDIYNYIKNEMPDYMIPKNIYFLDNIPVNFNGKIDRNYLENQEHVKINANANANANAHDDLPSDLLGLIKIWKEILNVSNISLSDDFFELGGDSLSAMILMSKIKDEFNVKLFVKDILEHKTLIDLIAVIKKRKNESQNDYDKYNSIFLLSASKNKKNVFLIHPIGGGVFWYSELSKKIDNHFSLYAIQDPSFESRDIMFNSLEEMASFYIKLVKMKQPRGNYIIGGASFGATIAFEMARQLESAGDTVDYVLMFDGWAIYPEQLKDKKSFDKIMKNQRRRLLRNYQNLGSKNAYELLAIQQHRFKLLQQYKITQINSKIILFKAKENWDLFHSIDAYDNYWSSLTTEPLITELSSGNHETMLFEPHVNMLCNKLNHYLKASLSLDEVIV